MSLPAMFIRGQTRIHFFIPSDAFGLFSVPAPPFRPNASGGVFCFSMPLHERSDLASARPLRSAATHVAWGRANRCTPRGINQRCEANQRVGCGRAERVPPFAFHKMLNGS
jgi:hypothetical protein